MGKLKVSDQASRMPAKLVNVMDKALGGGEGGADRFVFTSLVGFFLIS